MKTACRSPIMFTLYKYDASWWRHSEIRRLTPGSPRPQWRNWSLSGCSTPEKVAGSQRLKGIKRNQPWHTRKSQGRCIFGQDSNVRERANAPLFRNSHVIAHCLAFAEEGGGGGVTSIEFYLVSTVCRSCRQKWSHVRKDVSSTSIKIVISNFPIKVSFFSYFFICVLCGRFFNRSGC